MNSRSKARRAGFTLFVSLMLLGSRMSAQEPVFSNGLPDNNGGVPIGQLFSTANDFQLSGTTQLAYFDWYALFQGASGPTPLTANFFWKILSDAGGRPNEVIAGGNVVGAQGDLTSYGCCYPLPWEYQTYHFRTALNLTLAAGSYWLAVGEFNSDYPSSYYWANSQSGSGNEAKRWDGGEWHTYPMEGAFSISGGPGLEMNVVPEPATVLLMATGLGGLAAARRRRRSKS